MSRAKRLVFQIAFPVTLLIAFAGVEVAQRGLRDATPLRESPLIEFPSVSISQLEVQQFLEGDFRAVKDMRALPEPVIKAFTETGGTRLTIANPGKKFEATDMILNESLPRKRLLFAGVLADKCFMLYEQGGIGHFYVLALFKISSASVMQPIWRGYCGPATNIAELRSNVSTSKCSDPMSTRIR